MRHPSLGSSIYSLDFDSINDYLQGRRGTDGMGGRAKRFRVAPWRHSIHPDPDIGTVSGYRTPVEGVSLSQVFLRTGTKNRSGSGKFVNLYHLSQRNVLEWRQGYASRYQWVGWL